MHAWLKTENFNRNLKSLASILLCFIVGRRKLLKNAKINEGAKSRTKSLTVQDIANNVELKFILGYVSYSYHTL
jgi:hypothetical protein